MTKEKALENFDKLVNSLKSNHETVRHYYEKELLKYYIAYILRRGEAILRLKAFKKISLTSLKLICKADFLCASEVTVYKAIRR